MLALKRYLCRLRIHYPVRWVAQPIVVLLALFGCGGSDARFCFSTTEFCDDAFALNRDPNADISAPAEIVADEVVFLDGGGSSDPDGRVESYRWVQFSGPLVELESADAEVARFVAPLVDEEVEVGIRLTVTDDANGSDSASVFYYACTERGSRCGHWLGIFEQTLPAKWLGWVHTRFDGGDRSMDNDQDHHLRRVVVVSTRARSATQQRRTRTNTGARSSAVLLNRLALYAHDPLPPLTKNIVDSALNDVSATQYRLFQTQLDQVLRVVGPTALEANTHGTQLLLMHGGASSMRETQLREQAIALLLPLRFAQTEPSSLDPLQIASATHMLTSMVDRQRSTSD